MYNFKKKKKNLENSIQNHQACYVHIHELYIARIPLKLYIPNGIQ